MEVSSELIVWHTPDNENEAAYVLIIASILLNCDLTLNPWNRWQF